MKNVKAKFVLLVALLVLVWPAHREARAEDLNQTLNSIGHTLSSIQAELRHQDMVVDNATWLLGAYAKTVGEGSVSLPVFYSMMRSVEDIKGDLQNVQSVRAGINKTLSNIVNTLTNLSVQITSTS